MNSRGSINTRRCEKSESTPFDPLIHLSIVNVTNIYFGSAPVVSLTCTVSFYAANLPGEESW